MIRDWLLLRKLSKSTRATKIGNLNLVKCLGFTKYVMKIQLNSRKSSKIRTDYLDFPSNLLSKSHKLNQMIYQLSKFLNAGKKPAIYTFVLNFANWAT